MMDLITEIIIPNPPTKYVDRRKTKIDPKTGKLKEDVYYLTANLFYANISYFTRAKIVNAIKEYLILRMDGIPKLENCRVEIIYQKEKDNFDLDNKAYFWLKMFLDILKTPSSRQIKKALEKNRIIKTINCIDDDTVRFIDDIKMTYKRGEHKLIFKVYGKKKAEKIDLFS